MKYLTLLTTFLLFQTTAFSQAVDTPVQVTPAIEKKIKLEVTQEATQLKLKLIKAEDHADQIEFALDTFYIERYKEKHIKYDWSSVGIETAVGDAIDKYDSLLNKYYKDLMAALKPPARKTLISAEKSWLLFRDKELILIDSLTNEEYAGGSIIPVAYLEEYLNLVKDRVIFIFQYYYELTWEQ